MIRRLGWIGPILIVVGCISSVAAAAPVPDSSQVLCIRGQIIRGPLVFSVSADSMDLWINGVFVRTFRREAGPERPVQRVPGSPDEILNRLYETVDLDPRNVDREEDARAFLERESGVTILSSSREGVTVQFEDSLTEVVAMFPGVEGSLLTRRQSPGSPMRRLVHRIAAAARSGRLYVLGNGCAGSVARSRVSMFVDVVEGRRDLPEEFISRSLLECALRDRRLTEEARLDGAAN